MYWTENKWRCIDRPQNITVMKFVHQKVLATGSVALSIKRAKFKGNRRGIGKLLKVEVELSRCNLGHIGAAG